MATTIRSICYNKPGNPSLLVSSGLEEKMVFGFRMDYSAFAANMAGWNKLCEMELSPNHFYVKALPLELPFRLFFDFYCWWHEIVVSLPNSGNEILITREEIIRTVADKFGAHTDPETDDKKDEVEGEAIGWRFFSSTGYSGFPMVFCSPFPSRHPVSPGGGMNPPGEFVWLLVNAKRRTKRKK